MGLAHRVIPVLLSRGSYLVKGKQFNSYRVVGNVYQAAEIHQARGVDELMIIDVAATICGTEPDYDMIRELTSKCFMPITVGGGVRTIEHIRNLLANGADKVLIGTAALDNRDLIKEAAEKFGSQAIVIAIDVVYEKPNWFVTTYCGRRRHFYSPVAYAKELELWGAGELVVTSVLNDGMMDGYDLGIIRKIAKAVNIPVVANGGAGNYDHMARALKAGASAVAAGAMFQWTDATPRGASEYLAKKGWEVRL